MFSRCHLFMSLIYFRIYKCSIHVSVVIHSLISSLCSSLLLFIILPQLISLSIPRCFCFLPRYSQLVLHVNSSPFPQHVNCLVSLSILDSCFTLNCYSTQALCTTIYFKFSILFPLNLSLFK